MEVRVLRYFLAVVREESITRAAEVLHVTQPTLSRQLVQLEEEVGVKLFERGPRKIVLTSEGTLLRRRASEIIALVDKTARELTEAEQELDGKISIGCGELASMELLAELVASFSKKYPLVQYELRTATADKVKERMDRGLVDIGLLLEPISIDKYDFIRLSVRERWCVLMRPDDPLAGQAFVTAHDLKGQPLILPHRMNIQHELASWFGDSFEQLRIVFESDLTTNGAIMVQKGLAYSVTLEGAVPFWDKNKIACRPLAPELSATSVLAWKKQQPFSLAATKFIEHMKCYLSMKQQKN